VPDFSKITRYRVTGGRLLLGVDVEVPIASFEVSFAMDTIPSAVVTPAIGTSFRGQDWATVADVLDGETARLYITVNGTEQLLINGYVSAVSTTDESTLFARRIGASISIQQRMVLLAGAPAVSFAYASKGSSLQLLSEQKLNINIFDPGGDQKNGIEGIESYVAKFNRENPGAEDWPGRVLKSITMALFKQTNAGQISQSDLDDIIRIYEPANLSSLVLDGVTFLRNVGEKYSATWRSQNAFEALRQTARYLMMRLIPFNSGFYIADPYSLDKAPVKSIRTGEYISIGKQRTEHLSEPVNGVAMRKPAGVPYSSIDPDLGNYFRDAFIFPPLTDDGKARYYHYREFPPWLFKERGLTSRVVASGKPFSDKPSPNWNPDSSLTAYFTRIGDLIARAIYAQLLLEQTQIQLKFPYRIDLMPGTVIKLDNAEDSQISFVGDTLYGMVVNTRFVGSTMTEQPRLEVHISASSVRNEAQNDDDNYTFDGNPIYGGAAGRWAGIDIDGDFISAVPDVMSPSAAAPNTYNSASGQVAAK
jgi:hypothetical protein